MNHKKISTNNELNNQIIELDLTELNKKINDITSNKKLDKEIYSISNENIETILFEKKNEDGLRYANIGYNNKINIYQNILNNLKILNNKRESLYEKMNMLNEEKIALSAKIIEYISKKESMEESAKILLFKFFNETIDYEVKNDKINNKINNDYLFLNLKSQEKNIIINLYELHIIDIKNLSKEISNQIISAFNSFYIRAKYSNTNSLTNYQAESSYSNRDNIYNYILTMSSRVEKEILLFVNSFYNSNEEDKYVKNFQNLINDFLDNLSKNINSIFLFF